MKSITIRVRRNNARKPSPSQPENPFEFKIVCLRECPVDCPLVDDAETMVEFWRKHVTSAVWFKEYKEFLCVFLLNARKRLIGFELVGQGTLDAIVTRGAEVFRMAVIHNAAAIIVAHNHPSGDSTPSEADICLTRNLIRAGQFLNIEVVDHVVVGDVRLPKGFQSLRGLGYFYK